MTREGIGTLVKRAPVFWITFAALNCLSGCYCSAQTLATAMSEHLRSASVPLPKMNCLMNDGGRSRAGVCRFTISSQDVARFAAHWKLKKAFPADWNLARVSRRGCGERYSVEIQTATQKAIDAGRGPEELTPPSDEDLFLVGEKNNPPRTSANVDFSAFYFDKKTGMACVDLEFPYG